MSNSISRSSEHDKRRQQSIRAYARRSEPAGNRTSAKASSDGATLPFGKSGSRTGHRPLCDAPDGQRCRWLEILKVIAGFVLLVALSWEIIGGDHIHFSPLYLWIQFLVCVVFLCDFFIRWGRAGQRSRFFWRHLFFLLIAIPWLNILGWCGVRLTHDWGLLVGLIPMLRAFLAMCIIVQWMVSQRNRFGRIFWAYIFTVVVFTYLSALVFYDYEAGVNAQLHGFGNALWWGWMNVTTVGAQLFAVTGVGKVVTVLLPSLGMMFFPIFTTYILDRYTGKKTEA